MTNAIYNHSEAREEAIRLTKVLGREVVAKLINCTCDYSRDCGTCYGQGYTFSLVYDSCDHVVQDGDDLACIEGDCAHKSYLASIEREEQLEAV